MMIPTQVTLIPLFIIMNKLGLINTYPSVILPSLFKAFGIFMLVQQMRSVPNDYMEAARIDGAGLFRIYWKVILPLCRSAIATLSITTFMDSWNDYLWPLVMLTDKSKMTLTLALNSLNGQYGTQYNVLMAGSLLSMLPIILVYIGAQRSFKQGMLEGGVKG
jgi:multiple sugar transport system permease protein